MATDASPQADVDPRAKTAGPGWRAYLKALGPGLITGASDDDPSGIATYSQAGAKYGFGLLWTALLTLPLMATVQEICDRTALATGRDLGSLAVAHFRKAGRVIIFILLAALIVANGLNISADLVAIGAGMHMLHAGPSWLWAVLAGVGLTLAVTMGSFPAIARVFKVLCLALFAYLGVLVAVSVPWRHVAVATVIPHIRWNKDYFALLVAVLGTTISPYLFFWQTVNRVEEMKEEPEGGTQAEPIDERGPARDRNKLATARFDVFSGIGFSQLVMFAIIVTAATTLGAHGQHDIASADQAAKALAPVAGRFASTLFALGFIGSGVLAVPVLAASGAAGMASLLGKKEGFSRKPKDAKLFYGLVILGTLGGAALSLLGVNPIRLLVFVALINGLAAAPFLIIVMRISGDATIMREHVNGRLARTLGWLTVAFMAVAAVVVVATA